MTKDSSLNMRINAKQKKTLIRNAKKIGKPHTTLVCEMIQAFNEGRLTIKQSDNEKGLYDVN